MSTITTSWAGDNRRLAPPPGARRRPCRVACAAWRRATNTGRTTNSSSANAAGVIPVSERTRASGRALILSRSMQPLYQLRSLFLGASIAYARLLVVVLAPEVRDQLLAAH